MFLSCFLRKHDAETEQLKQQRRKHDSDQRKQKQISKVKQMQALHHKHFFKLIRRSTLCLYLLPSSYVQANSCEIWKWKVCEVPDSVMINIRHPEFVCYTTQDQTWVCKHVTMLLSVATYLHKQSQQPETTWCACGILRTKCVGNTTDFTEDSFYEDGCIT